MKLVFFPNFEGLLGLCSGSCGFMLWLLWVLAFWVWGSGVLGFGFWCSRFGLLGLWVLEPEKAQGPDLTPGPFKQAFFKRKKSSFGGP